MEVIKIKIEIEIPEEVGRFYKSRAVYNQRTLEDEIIYFLIIESKKLRELPFDEAFSL